MDIFLFDGFNFNLLKLLNEAAVQPFVFGGASRKNKIIFCAGLGNRSSGTNVQSVLNE
jgi:hypothetical protein